MDKLIGLKGSNFEVVGIREALVKVNPPFNEPVEIRGYSAEIKGNACSAEMGIEDCIGDNYTAIAVSPTLVQIYNKNNLDWAIAKSPALPGITVNAVWYINTCPTHAVAELPDRSLVMFRLNPFRMLAQGDFRSYKGHHPRKVKGQPLPDYLYRFYGLSKNTESATEVIHVRLTPAEKNKLETAAKNAGETISEYTREWVRSL